MISIAQLVRLCKNKAVKSYAVAHWSKIRKATEYQAREIIDALVTENLDDLKKILEMVK